MTKIEIWQWMGANRQVYCGSDYDGCGNQWSYRIFDCGGQLYRVEFCNGSPSPKRGPRGQRTEEYEPERVVRQVVMVEEVRFVKAP